MMKAGAIIAFFGLGLLAQAAVDAEYDILRSRDLLPRAPLGEIYHYARSNLDEEHPMVRDLATHFRVVARSINEKRMALPLAYAEAYPAPKGGGGGGAIKMAGKANNVGGGGGGGGAAPPPGLNADGQKAWDQCQKAQSNAGDCSAMRGPFAEMGCSLGSIHNMKPCENKNLQSALKSKYCSDKGKNDKKNCK